MKKIFISIALLIAVLFTTNVYADTTAEFKWGSALNIAMKKIAEEAVSGDASSVTGSTIDTHIKEIRRAYSINLGSMTSNNIVSIPSSDNEIYMWFNKSNGILYYYSDADVLYLSEYSNHAFSNLAAVEKIDLTGVDSSRVRIMSYMFLEDSSLQELNLSGFDTSNVEAMTNMFYGCSSLTTLNLNNFNTSNVTDMSGMFLDCINLKKLYIRNFDTSNVTNMEWMFSGCSSITGLNLSHFNTSKVTSMRQMFSNMHSLKSINLSGFDTRKVTNMSGMFLYDYSLQSIDLSSFRTPLLENMDYMFNGCSSIEELNMSTFTTSNVTSMINAFSIESLKKLDISSFELTNIGSDSYDVLNYLFGLSMLKTPKSIKSGISLGLWNPLYYNTVEYFELTSTTPKQVWMTRPISVDFDANGADFNVLEPMTVNPGETISVANPTSSKYNFNGWCLDSECTKEWTNNYLLSDTTLYAKWTGKISTVTISSISDRTYTGKAITPNPYVKFNGENLTKNVDYKLSYTNNINVGTATLTVTGIGKYSGTKSTTFKIVGSTPISGASVTFPTIANQVYTGSKIKPKVTLKYGTTVLKEGTDYTIVYGANTDVGIGRVKIVFKGNYTGTRILTFKIIPSGTSITKLTNPSSGTIRVQYNESVGATGYQIAYRARGSSTWNYARTSGLIRNINGLDITRYEVKVRPWSNIDGTNYYGSWSTGKGITIN